LGLLRQSTIGFDTGHIAGISNDGPTVPQTHTHSFSLLSTYYNERQALEVMGLFPPKSQIHIASGNNAVIRTLGDPAKSTKELGTFRTHCIHWFAFCLDMKLEGHMALKQHLPIQRCVWQMVLCTVHLATSNAVLCRSIKAATISKYLLSIAKFCACLNPRNPRKLEQANKALAPAIQGVINEVQR
jgi:hypothetical protein